MEVFYVAPPEDLPQKVMECIEYLLQGNLWAKLNMPHSYDDDYNVSIQVLKRLHKCFTECNDQPVRGMMLMDSNAGFNVNVKPVLEFLVFMKENGTSSRNFDVIESLMSFYLHQDNIQEFKKVNEFIRNIETALYEYQD